jgi:hypothetical protein
MPAAKFFHNVMTQVHLGAPRAQRNKKGDPTLIIPFRIPLNGNTVRSAPDFIRSAYDGIKDKGAKNTALEKEFDNIDMDIFNLQENRRANQRLPRLRLTNLVVKKTKNSEGDWSTVLSFQTEYPWDSAIWEYLGQHYKTDVFAKFDAAQASLLDAAESAAEGDVGEEEEEEEEGDGANGSASTKRGKQGEFNIEEFQDAERSAAVAEIPTRRGKGRDAAGA